MSRKYFGTDGVRGRANSFPLTADMALRVGAAVGNYFRNDGGNGHRVVIGKDTRLSGYMFENALTAGLTSSGMNVLLLGPVPTPAVGLLSQSLRADLGIMISASHNPYFDNGIKFFGPDGFKLSDAVEHEIEALIDAGVDPAPGDRIGWATRVDDGRFRYAERLKATLPSARSFDGLKVVIDCANGAAYRVAPEVLWELGAEVIPVGVSPNGRNINDGVGSTAPEAAARAVREHGADIGICLDGDADRILVLDETGRAADGDQVMALLAERFHARGQLAGGTLVATVMSNLGLERHLTGQGLSLHRTAVGDRYVVEAMRKHGWTLGGEQSGHIVMTDIATTGDGLLAGLNVLSAMVGTGRKASDLLHVFDTVPQKLVNVTYESGTAPLEAPAVQAAITEAEARLSGQGRLLIRKSGTEPKIRVMAECEDEALLSEVVDGLADLIARA